MSDYKEGASYIKHFEGFRDIIYKDSLGNLTCGWGHYLKEGSKIPKIISHILFKMDYAKARRDCKQLEGELGFKLDPVRKIVLVDLIFNMGLGKVRRFKRMLAALKLKDFNTAASELEDSLYFTQVGVRGVTNRDVLRTGKLYETSKS